MVSLFSSSPGRMCFFYPFGDFPPVTNNVRPSQEGVTAATHRRHGLEVEDERHLKDFIVSFVFIEVLCTDRCFS
jgi:hypothetical protein